MCSLCTTKTSAQNVDRLEISATGIQAVMDQIDKKAKTLCQYIVDIGSSKSQISHERKDYIIKNELPLLFWRFEQRIVTTSSGVNGNIIRKKPILNYFLNLQRQSKTAINKEVRYELMYDKVYSDSKIKDVESWERLPDYDNCQVWRQTVRLTQTYYVLNQDFNGNFEFWSNQKVVKKEVDRKYMYVYLIVRKDDSKKLALIGDIYMVERLEAK